jgi:hypothetical protein
MGQTRLFAGQLAGLVARAVLGAAAFGLSVGAQAAMFSNDLGDATLKCPPHCASISPRDRN